MEDNKNTNTVTQVEKTFTQSELDNIISERLQRERSKYADYEDIKAKADKYDEMEEASKSELEKITEKAAEYEKKYNDMVAQQKITAMRAKVANEKNVPASLITATTEEDAVKQAEALIDFKGGENGKKDPAIYPSVKDKQGNNGGASVKEIFGDWLNKNF